MHHFSIGLATAPTPLKSDYGFTLVELLVSLSVVAIITSVAAPSFTALMKSTSISSSVNTFLADMRFARAEALRRGGGVVMCRSDAPEAATPACGTGSGPGGNGWVSGWIIFHDLNNDGTKAAAEPLLRVQSAITAPNSIVEMNVGSSSTKFSFSPTGRLSLGTSRGLQFGSTPAYATGTQRVVCINLGGRARIAGDGSFSCTTDQ